MRERKETFFTNFSHAFKSIFKNITQSIKYYRQITVILELSFISSNFIFFCMHRQIKIYIIYNFISLVINVQYVVLHLFEKGIVCLVKLVNIIYGI